MLFAVEAERRRLAFARKVKRAGHPVPNRKHAAEVLVPVLRRVAVMDLVYGRTDEDAIERACWILLPPPNARTHAARHQPQLKCNVGWFGPRAVTVVSDTKGLSTQLTKRR